MTVKFKGDFVADAKKLITEKSLDKIDTMVVALKMRTPVDTGKAREGWYRDGNNIRNEVKYMTELNEGASQQAPSRFIEATVLAFDGVRPSGSIVKPLAR